MLGKLMVNTINDGNSCGGQLNELVVIETNEIVCNDEPYYPMQVERSHMEAIALAVNSHQAMKEALEAIVARLDGDYDNPSLTKQGPLSVSSPDDIHRFAKQALTLANGGQP